MELAKELPYAPEILRARGYHTAAFIGSIILEPNPPYAPGFDRGLIPTMPGSTMKGREKIATAPSSVAERKWWRTCWRG